MIWEIALYTDPTKLLLHAHGSLKISVQTATNTTHLFDCRELLVAISVLQSPRAIHSTTPSTSDNDVNREHKT